MLAALLATPVRVITRGAPFVSPCWLRPAPTHIRHTRLLLSPGVWIRRDRPWLPVTVLNTAELIPELDVEPNRQLWPVPDWHETAQCRNVGDPDYADQLFFGVDNVARPALSPTVLSTARGYCDSCPVKRDCLVHALAEGEEFGVWGGSTGRQRRKMFTKIKAGADPEKVADAWLTR